MMFSKILATTTFMAATALVFAGVAQADPAQKPNLTTGDCPGGKGGMLAVAWCNGEKFPDGSYWHNVAMTGGTFATPRFEMNCVIDDAFPSGTLAPPGGCGGAV
ncbi:hypothetical protein [Mycolicibacter virginiensis]|uniref:hypothetical protein n=1 Tax=Mycolicibacter virginiensis TaxID=1795032 RepID=UPI0010575CF4|nr:hypothetical protein [Mycolicibacter virginiensis]